MQWVLMLTECVCVCKCSYVFIVTSLLLRLPSAWLCVKYVFEGSSPLVAAHSCGNRCCMYCSKLAQDCKLACTYIGYSVITCGHLIGLVSGIERLQ